VRDRFARRGGGLWFLDGLGLGRGRRFYFLLFSRGLCSLLRAGIGRLDIGGGVCLFRRLLILGLRGGRSRRRRRLRRLLGRVPELIERVSVMAPLPVGGAADSRSKEQHC